MLRPLALGELLDRSVTFWRAHWRPLFFMMLCFQLVELAGLKATQGITRALFPLMSSAELMSLAERAPETVLPQALGAGVLAGLAVCFMLLVSQISGVAVTHYGWQRLVGAGAPSAADALRHAAQRLTATLGAFALSLAWSLVVMVLFLLPGVLLAVGAVWASFANNPGLGATLMVLAGVGLVGGALLVFLWFVLRFVLLSAVLAVEDVGAWTAFRRADTLSSGRVLLGALGVVKLRLTILITVMGGVLLMMSAVASLPSLLAGAAYGASFLPGRGLEAMVPAAVLVPIEVVQTVLGSIVAPLYVVFQFFFYADMRMRREGLDLELALRR